MKKKNQSATMLSPENFIRQRGREIPVEVCYLAQDALEESGIGVALVVRRHSGGRRTVGAYLIDRFCLGVKDTFFAFRLDECEYEDFMASYRGRCDLVQVDYAVAHNWVFGAVEWASDAGIKPHKDFALTKWLLEDDEDETVPLIEFDFGYKGGYFLFVGTREEADRYIPVLDEHLGKGNYKITVGNLFNASDTSGGS